MITVVATSVGYWEEYVEPMICSFSLTNTRTKMNVVDQDARFPVYPKNSYKGARIIPAPNAGRPRAMNLGMWHAGTNWVMCVDDDVLCTAPKKFYAIFKDLDPNTIYGNHLFYPEKVKGLEWANWPWLDGWSMAIHKKVLQTIDAFDINFWPSGFQDADFCWRALEAGFSVKQFDFPIKHLGAKTKFELHGGKDKWMKLREKNIEYLERKWKDKTQKSSSITQPESGEQETKTSGSPPQW